MKKIAMLGFIHQDGWDVLKEKGYEVFGISNLSKENVKKEIKDVVGIGLRTSKLDSEILQSCKNLRIVSRHGVGYDNVDLNYLNDNKKALAITGTSNAVSVAEHVMTMFLYLAKQINKSDELTKKGNFKDKASLPNFFELYKKNILILGFGRIGQAVAKRCLGFESNILIYDPYVEKKFIESKGYHKVDLDQGISNASFITIHMPLNEETNNLISNEKFDLMKKDCVIVNTARGGIVNEKDLASALIKKNIYGAGLDVYETEPPESSNPLLKLDNIILTPHNAALTLECRKRMAIEMSENIIYYLENDNKLNKQNIVNHKILDL
jgi:D-3-phosphoglycerate dehydrogenase